MRPWAQFVLDRSSNEYVTRRHLTWFLEQEHLGPLTSGMAAAVLLGLAGLRLQGTVTIIVHSCCEALKFLADH